MRLRGTEKHGGMAVRMEDQGITIADMAPAKITRTVVE